MCNRTSPSTAYPNPFQTYTIDYPYSDYLLHVILISTMSKINNKGFNPAQHQLSLSPPPPHHTSSTCHKALITWHTTTSPSTFQHAPREHHPGLLSCRTQDTHLKHKHPQPSILHAVQRRLHYQHYPHTIHQ